MRRSFQHPWNVSASEAFQLPHQLRAYVQLTDDTSLSSMRRIAAGVSFSGNGQDLSATAALTGFPDPENRRRRVPQFPRQAKRLRKERA